MKIFDNLNNIKKSAEAEKMNEHKLISFYLQIRGAFKDKKKKFLIVFFVLLFITIYLCGLFSETSMRGRGLIDEIYYDPVSVCYAYFVNLKVTFLLSFFLILIEGYAVMYLSRLFGKNSIRNEEDRVNEVDDGSYGNAHWMTDEEKAEAMIMSKNVKELSLDILGEDDEGYKYCRKEVQFTNGNVGIIGPPGSGKSICIVYNDIYQAIKRGESFCAVDSKGSVYKNTAYVAERAGYDVKIFNIKPDEVMHSDACDFLGAIDTKDTEKAKSAANTLTTVIMNNIGEGGERKDIWYTSSFNLLKAMMLIVKFDDSLPESKKTLATVYDTLVDNSDIKSLERTFEYISYNRKHPAYVSWRTYLGEPEAVRTSALGGLLTNLNFLDNEYIKAIVSNPEIDFEAPGKRKCAYYLVISDIDKSNNVLAPLFVESLFIKLTAFADKQPNEELPVKVNIEIDEFKNVGKLPMYTEKLSTVRSRGINMKWIIQDKSQIMQMYPDEEWRTIIADCSTILVLKVGENDTADYIEAMLGTRTISIKNTASMDSVGNALHLHPDYRLTEGKGNRPLMYAHEIKGQGKYGLKKTELLVLIDGEAPLKLKKFMYWEHPFYKVLKMDLPEHRYRTVDHVPQWYAAFDEDKKREQEKEFMKKKVKVSETENQTESENSSVKTKIIMRPVNPVSKRSGGYAKRKGL